MKTMLSVLPCLLLIGQAAAVVVDPTAETRYKELATRVLIENAGGMPALCRAANGDLLFGFATHWEQVPAGGVIKLMRSRDEGKTWSKPRTIIRPKTPDWSTQFWSGLHLAPDGSLILSHTQCRYARRPNVPPEEKSPAKIYDTDWSDPTQRIEACVIRSHDHGQTWEAPTPLTGVERCFAVGRPVSLRDGSVLLPMWGPEPNGQARCASLFVRSRDNGKTWGDLQVLAGGPLGFNEVTLGVAANGDVVAVLRDCEAGPRRLFRQSVSHDNGKTWRTPWKTTLYGKMPDMLVLPSGRILLAVGSVDCMDGGLVFKGPPNSSYAGLFISDDNGRTWRRDVMFTTSDPDQLIPFDAPVLARLRNGHVLAIAFSADRKYDGDPLMGWTRGMHYTIHQLAPR